MIAVRPEIGLNEAALRANAIAWRHFAGTALRAVIKADGYGWGVAPVVRALEGAVDGFAVADADELAELRRITHAPAVTLADTGPADSARVVALGGIPNVARLDSLDAALAAGANRIRVGLRLAAGWSAIDEPLPTEFVARVAASRIEVEVWTHLADVDARDEDAERFDRFEAQLRDAGAAVVARDLESTSSTRMNSRATSVRIGVGLFGARLGAHEPRLRCAIRADAPVVERFRASDALKVGYGSHTVAPGTALVVARCGYSDGFPRIVRRCGSLLSVGMQYTIAYDEENAPMVRLLTSASDLDELAAASSAIPHELVCRFGRMRPPVC